MKFSGWMDGWICDGDCCSDWMSEWRMGGDLLEGSQTISLNSFMKTIRHKGKPQAESPPTTQHTHYPPPLLITNVYTLLLCLPAADRLQTKVISLSIETRGLKELIGKFKLLNR